MLSVCVCILEMMGPFCAEGGALDAVLVGFMNDPA